MRLLLVRHGRSAHASAWRPLDRDGVRRWRADYDEAGIAHGDRPPHALVAEVARARLVAASDLPRAHDSAMRLAPGRDVLASPLFREVALPLPPWGPRRAPLPLWEAFIHAQWVADIARARDATPDVAARLRDAVAWCWAEAAGPNTSGAPVVIVTHGVFRRLLATALIAAGWRAERAWRSYAHWSAWRLVAPPNESRPA
jgi:broad specificity phosphatase PhoE